MASLQLDSGSYVQFANNATLASATKVHGAFNVSGAFLNSLAGLGGVIPMDIVAKADLSLIKGGLVWYGPSGFFGMFLSDAAGRT